MKKKILMLAGVLSCAMMVFSIQADSGDSDMDDLGQWHGHRCHKTEDGKRRCCKYKYEKRGGKVVEHRECWTEKKSD